VKRSQPEDEQELLALARTNDKQAIGALYDRYATHIYGYLYRRIGDAQVAEDLTGDVFVKVLEAIRSQRVWRLSFQGWLYRIAHNVAVDWFRSRESAVREPLDGLELAADTPEPGAQVAALWSHQDLYRALLALPEAQQQVLVLRFGEGLKTREVAGILGKSVGAVEALQHRALSALKEQLDE
jgi:RNA polymerase sigma-70 factor, ECF subfamily